VPGVDGPVRVVGRLGPAQPYVGFIQADDGCAVVVGSPATEWRRDPTEDATQRRAGLVCLAIAFFLESLTDPPPELEATHADVAGMMRSLAANGSEAGHAAALAEALDAIDDGLAADAVVLLLQRLLPPDLDAVATLRQRAEVLTRG
jgi:hypothetical protein